MSWYIVKLVALFYNSFIIYALSGALKASGALHGVGLVGWHFV